MRRKRKTETEEKKSDIERNATRIKSQNTKEKETPESKIQERARQGERKERPGSEKDPENREKVLAVSCCGAATVHSPGPGTQGGTSGLLTFCIPAFIASFLMSSSALPLLLIMSVHREEEEGASKKRGRGRG